MSVMVPVRWVVRISALEILVISAFCKPMMKHSNMTVAGTNSPSIVDSRAPSRPKPSSSSASISSGSAYSLYRPRRRA